MPCHDILIETAIQNATQNQVDKTADMWKHMVDRLGIALPAYLSIVAARSGSLMLTSSYEEQPGIMAAVRERYQQTYVARQIFDALMADGYEMEAWVEPDHEGTWVIRARDVTRNATIGVVVYRTMEFEIDFLDALHDDSVWLAGGEFGRVIERIRDMGLAAEVVKLDIDEEAKRHLRQTSGLLT